VIIPAYGSATIADLLPSIGAHLGVPGCREDVLGLPNAERYVVVLVDGLGWHLVRGAIRDAPYLASLLGDGKPITAGVPSTTVTSLASLGTGLPPGQHGMVGYTSRVPSTGEILNALTWESDLVARSYQSKPTLFERAARAGVAVSSVALERFEFSGLTEAGLRGPDFVGYADERAGDRRTHLARIDTMVERLRDELSDDVVLIVTGDHGMVDVPRQNQIVAEDEPELMAGVDALAGEGRFRQLYVDREHPSAVAARWADRLGELAWVRTREEAIEEGWFGPVDPELRERWGHVLVAMRTDWAVMTRQFPRELSLVGMHGSLTAAEMTVPLFVD
jgi:Type I phosphodiesterase / nucleotide pyrophosphatase